MTFECTNEMCDQPSVQENDEGVTSNMEFEIHIIIEIEGNILDKPAHAWYCSVCTKANIVDENGIEILITPTKEYIEMRNKMLSKLEKICKEEWGDEE